MTIGADVMEAARTLVRDQLGLDFPARRDADLARALEAASDDPRALVAALHHEPPTGPAWRGLIDALTVQESYFFRDTAFFGALAEHVLPDLIQERRGRGDLRLALWSAGCAGGQEPYSLAILLHRLVPDRERWDLRILASDVNPQALETARAGVYTRWALRGLPSWARPYLPQRGVNRFEVHASIRAMVRFVPLNLALDPFGAGWDLIVCRNVLMYLSDDVRHATVQRLGRALAPSGRLALSPLDSTPEREAPLLAAEEAFGVRLLRPAEQPEAEPATVPPAPAPLVPSSRALPTLARARAAADEGRLQDALTLCLQALRDDPLDAEAHLLTAAVEEERGDLVAACVAARRAIYSAPDEPTAHLRLGTLLLRRGEETAAQRSLRTAAHLLGDRAPASLLARVAS